MKLFDGEKSNALNLDKGHMTILISVTARDRDRD